MRKILIALITVIVVVLAVKAVTDKIEIDDIEVLGIKELEAKETALDNKIKEGEIAEEEYDTAYAKINTAYKKLSNAKEEYEEKVAAIAAKNTEEAKLLQNYSIEFLWIEIGEHQKKEGVKLDLTFTASGESSETDILTDREVGIWDINFTVTGDYEAITDFIYDIEGDSKLGFGIEDFTLNPGSTVTNKTTNSDGTVTETKTTELVAKFTCSGVRIYTDSLKSTSSLGGSIFNSSSSSSSNSNDIGLVDDSEDEEKTDDNDNEETDENSEDNKQKDDTTNGAE